MIHRDDKFMKEALRLAGKGLGRTSPNPAVGAVIVRRGRVVASGFHKKAGANHAEVEALSALGGRAGKGDTMYVTLEPCNHQGRTPPCTVAILESGLKKVVVGMLDPNPTVPGGGAQFLKERGVEVRTGLLEAECRRLNEAYVKYITSGRPFVLAKSALTVDGWSATSTGHSRWVTSERSRMYVHRLRDMVDGVLVGVGTVIADDPMLTTRLKNRRGRDPVRIIVDTGLRIPHNARVLNHDSAAMTFIVTGDNVPLRALREVEKDGVSTVLCPKKKGRIDLAAMMDILGRMSITSLMVEGGAGIMGSMIRERLVDKFHIFMAPKILGGGDGIPMASGNGPKRMDESLALKGIEVKRLGDDLLLTGYPDY